MRPYAKPTTSEWYISSRHTAFNQQPVIYKSELVTGLEQLFYYTANTSHKDQKENIKKKKEKKKKNQRTQHFVRWNQHNLSGSKKGDHVTRPRRISTKLNKNFS